MARQPGIHVRSLLASVDGASHDVWWGDAHVITKPPNAENPRLVANELICARLAWSLGLPVPAGDVGNALGQGQAWVSAQLEADFAPPDVVEVVSREPRISAGAVVFDTWVGNGDRHEGNILYHRTVGLWLIDHDAALCAWDGDPVVEACADRADDPVTLPFFKHALLPPQHVEFWIRKVQTLPMSVVREILADTRRRRLIDADTERAYLRYLLHRKNSLVTLVSRSRGEEGDTPWVMPLGTS